MNRIKHTMTDQQLDELLTNAHKRQWTGPDHSPKVDRYLNHDSLNHNSKGPTMKSQPNRFLSHSALILIGVSALAGGSLAAVVTHTIMSRHATLITDDGTQYDVELLESPDGASGTFVTDDGTVFGIDMVEQDAQQHVTVDVNSPNGGLSTVILDNGVAPSVLTKPGETARIEIDQSDDEKPSDSDE
jgi:hypothetical protein